MTSQITGEVIAEQVNSLLAKNQNLEQVLYEVTKNNIQYLPHHLKDDPQEISRILSAAQFYAQEVHPEFISGYKLHDLVLLRLLPKKKTMLYIEQQINEE